MALKKVRRPVLSGESKVTPFPRLTEESKRKLVTKHVVNHDIEIFPYKLKGQDFMVWDEKKEKYFHISKAVKINSIKRNLESKDIEVELVFWVYDKWETLTINRGELAKRELKKLASKGLDVLGDKQAAEVSAFLSMQEKSIKPTNIHKEIGWDIVDGQLVYKHYKLIAKKSSKSIDSTYAGEFMLEPKGNQ
jgi:hypothetical protein